MQLPMRAVSMVSMKPLESSATSAASMDMGRALSGEWGPTTWGSRVERSISTSRSKYGAGSSATSGSGVTRAALALARSARSPRPVARRYRSMRSSYGNTEVVAPSSAPMLVMVALPVQLMEAAPGPKYSMMALVPPDTVSSPREAEDDVLGRGPPAHLAGEPDADVAGVQELPGQAGHDLDGICAADADGAGAEAAGVGCVGVGADDHRAGEGVVLEDDLVDYAGARAPESRAELRGGGAEEGVDLVVLLDGLDEVDAALDAGLDEVVAVDGGGDGGGVAAGLHEVEHDGLAEDVLECDAVGPERELALALGEVLAGGVVEVAEEELVGEG